MSFAQKRVQEWRNVDKKTFLEQIVPQNKPAVLKGLLADWPSVREGKKSPDALAAYIKKFDQGLLARTAFMPSSRNEAFFYNGENLQRTNFEVRQEKISTVMDFILKQQGAENPLDVAIQAMPLTVYLPKFADENSTDLPHEASIPRIWISNESAVTTHYDLAYNIACIVGGHRRFTLFPPEQLPNLYVGPLRTVPVGTPVSMVSLEKPDLARYPRFEQAMTTAEVADLEPGDAIYVPFAWWHHVRALDGFNVLINHWWNGVSAPLSSPYLCLLHGMLAIQNLPQDQRAVLRDFFDYFVFRTNGIDPAAHLDPRYRDIYGPLTPEVAEDLKNVLLKGLGG